MKIDFRDLGMPVFTGRSRGEKARQRIGLDKLADDEIVDVNIPDEVYTVTSSYFLGLFAPSVKALGGRERFLDVFRFVGPDFILTKLDDWIDRALREGEDIFGVSK